MMPKPYSAASSKQQAANMSKQWGKAALPMRILTYTLYIRIWIVATNHNHKIGSRTNVIAALVGPAKSATHHSEHSGIGVGPGLVSSSHLG
jgi:hypothetical protein